MNVCRMTDVGKGICCHGNNHTATGKIISSAATVYAEGLQVARNGDILVSDCHEEVGTIISTATVYAEGAAVACLGDVFTGCFSGVLIEGASTVYAGTAFSPTGAFKTKGFGPLNLGRSKGKPGKAYIQPIPKTEVQEVTQPPPSTTPPVSCLTVSVPPPDDFQLSPSFKLKDLSTAVALPQSRTQVIAQAGLSVGQIVCNLQGWCENVGEQLAAKVGRSKMIITSGFRRGSGTSQHNRGQAADVQFPNMTNPEVWEVALWVKANVSFDQLIIEYGGRRPWLHISFNRDGNRPATAGNKFGTQNFGNNYSWGTIDLKHGNSNVPTKKTT